ncbi:hypothetical protein GA0070616_1346 [Micromonospora nigra]|uniref:Phage-related minor tail protein n=1 Tax=Micromonospora nigra TaxID=145857 RepID=A0A1C6RKN2_9ACTN|nr:hypothetical protein [Micromonospora nigra]SCL17732.1 hypothetical protein GA0070616_1346 [Micromonospora nigra]
MSDRTVSVRLRLMVRDYTSGATEAERMTRRLRDSQEALGSTSRRTAADLTKSAKAMDVWSRRAFIGTAAVAGGAAAAGGSLKLLAPALVATGAAAGALPGLVGGAAASLGTLKVATMGVGDALDDLFANDDPFARLSPSAKALVNEIGRLKPQLLDFQQSVQDAALSSAAGNFNRLATTTLPRLTNEAVILGRAWDRTFTALTDAATDATVLDGIGVASRSSARFMDELAIRTQALARSVAILMMAADPLTRLIGDRLVGAIDRMNAAAEKARRTGSLDEFFRSGVETGGALLSIVGDILTISGQVVAAVNRQNSSIVGTAEALDSYISSGRSARDIAGIVDTLTAAYEGMADVLGPLGGIARDALADPGVRDGLALMFEVLAAGSQALRVVWDLFNALDDDLQAVVIAAFALGLAAKKTGTALTLMGVAAQGAATRLTALGAAGAVAGRGLTGFVGVAGKALAALVALQLAGVAFEQFEPAAANVDRLTDSLRKFTQTGQETGELTRLFGDELNGLNKAAAAAGDGFFAKTARALESMFPHVKSLNEIFQGGSFTGSVERFQALDAAITEYARTTNDAAGTQAIWNRVLSESGLDATELVELLPRATQEMTRLHTAAHTGANSVQALEERSRLLGDGLQEAVRNGRSFIDVFNEINGKAIETAEAEIRAEETVDRLTEALKRNGRALNKRGTDFDVTNEKGRENKQLTIDLLRLGAQYAEGVYRETDSVEKADAAYERYAGRLRKVLGDKKLTAEQIDALIAKYGQMPDYKEVPVSAPGLPEATGNVEDFNFAVKSVPPSKTVPFWATTASAEAAVRVLKNRIDALKSKNIYITGTVRWTSTGDLRVPGGRVLRGVERWGGVWSPTVAMAAGGVMQAGVYAPSNPPLIMWAEPETGGEAYIPRKGDPRRSLSILDEAAGWYGAQVTPMAAGGIVGPQVVPAASGLVSVGRSTSGGGLSGGRLDTIDAYIRARDALVSLNKELKENGRSFSLSTAKGRENYSAVISAVQAAKQAAQAKYEETGSVKAANAAYDSHIKRLRATLKQQGVNAATIKKLLSSLTQRPTFGDGPQGSAANIAATEARIGAQEALGDLADYFSLVKPTFDLGDETGRDNLKELFEFLRAAERAAQAVFDQTGSSKSATGVYDSYIAQLRQILARSGLGQKQIDALLAQYGKIVLTPNAVGGVYAGTGPPLRLSEGGLYNSARALYGFAEPGTGGEMFLPRLGSRRRGEDLLSIGAGWYGGRFVPGGSSQATPTQVTNTLTVNEAGRRFTVGDMQVLLRQMDARARVGRKG